MTEVDMLDFVVYLQYKIRSEYDSLIMFDEIEQKYRGQPPTSAKELMQSINELLPAIVLEYQDIGMGWKDPEKFEPEE